nr:helix-turn-helix transcriptional regulator [uncultured Agathobaculum sp.]
MSLNDRIKQARLNAGLTQEQLGERIGVAKTTVAGYEKNREPDAATLGALMDALKVDANFLFQDEMRELETDDLTVPEIKHIKKYRTLDEYGKAAVDSILNIEYKRCAEQADSPRPMVMAAARSGAVSQIEEIRPDELPDNTPLP